MAKKSNPLRLADITYPPECWSGGFGDVVTQPSSAKYEFKQKSRKFFSEVLKVLEHSGKYRFNPGGVAVPGNGSLLCTLSEGRLLYLDMSFYQETHATLFWRVGHKSYAVDGVNQWLYNGELTAQEIALRIKKKMSPITLSCDV